MGGRREQNDPDEPLPRGLFKHWRQYRARDIDGKTWRHFGTDYADAVKGYKAWQRDGCAPADTVAWLLDFFTVSFVQLASRQAILLHAPRRTTATTPKC